MISTYMRLNKKQHQFVMNGQYQKEKSLSSNLRHYSATEQFSRRYGQIGLLIKPLFYMGFMTKAPVAQLDRAAVS